MTQTKIWLNGNLVDPEQAVVSVFDHGMLVGDGVFETVRAEHGEPFGLTRHLRRLSRSAAGLNLPELDQEALARGTREVLDAAPKWPLARIRVTVTSGVGPLGSNRGDSGLTISIIVAEQAPFPSTEEVSVAPWPRNERGALAGLKTTSYAEMALALDYARQRGCGEALFGTLAGDLCEGTGSNVFVVKGGRLLTPPASTSGCLEGVTRGLILEWCDGVEEEIPLEDLYTAEEAFLTSTTRIIQPIRAVDGTALPAAPGPVTAKAQETFAARAAERRDP
ncbi:aminotransferase class IV [Actinomadura roseirufa]|uniref:aminotransferase class IV n=1 Tax=Actinomadura roseirufa TaxID=2094049 RepID=UPI001F5F3F38|nr:aminotransferase class IV [Actinomadura roseirufa]